LNRQTFDVLVADIGMPEQDGHSLIRAVRSLPESHGGRVPAVAVTAYASLGERDQAIGAGYDWHLAKPVEPEALVAAVASVIAAASAKLVAEPPAAPPPGQPTRPIQPRPPATRQSTGE
jgi:CheY-like chemotaxis protein